MVPLLTGGGKKTQPEGGEDQTVQPQGKGEEQEEVRPNRPSLDALKFMEITSKTSGKSLVSCKGLRSRY